MDNYLTTYALPALQQKVGQGNEFLLEMNMRWENHRIMNKWFKLFFTYLDRWYVKHQELPTLEEAGLRSFRTQVYEVMRAEITKTILSLVKDEREGKLVDRSLIKNIIELYETMGWIHMLRISKTNSWSRSDSTILA
jgi:cullin 1